MKYTPEQTTAIETLAKSLCVDAGAGSGKTSVLVERIVLLLDRKLAALDEIVAITFTDKAAAEMKDRLRNAFHLKAPIDDPDEMTRWREMERWVETARVTTIHSFCAGLLRENVLRIGLDPDFVVLADAEAMLLCDEVATDAIHALLEQEDPAVRRAAIAFGTRRLIDTMKFMLNRGNLVARIFEEHPLADPAALAAHWRQLADKVYEDALKAWAGSPGLALIRDGLAGFEGACSNVDDGREQARRAMMAALDTIISSAEEGRAGARRSQGAIETIAALSFKNTRKKNWISEETVEDLKELQDYLRKQAQEHRPQPYNEVIEQRAAQLACDLCAVYSRVDEAYQSAKTERAGLDFDDLIGNALRMLRENDEVRGRTAHGIRFLLVDEFQDTDSAQLEIARLIADHPKGPDLFIVGDAKQSIYDFRGAEVEVFQRERQSALEVVRLDANFRTVAPLLSFVNDFFSRSGLLEAVEPAYTPLKAVRTADDPCRVEFLIPETQDGVLVDDYRKREGELIASRLSSLCRGDAAVSVFDKRKDIYRAATFGDVAMLFHSLNRVYLYEEGLRRCGIPYTVVAGAGFYERQEVLDLRNLLSVLVDPWDEMALLGFLRGPMAGLSDETLVGLCAERGLADAFLSNKWKEWDKWDGRDGQDGREQTPLSRFEAACVLVRDLRAHRAMPLAAFLRYVLDRTGYEAIMLTQYLGVQKAYNVRKIADLADDFARMRPASLGAFVRYLDEMASQETIREGDAAVQPDGSGAVTLMTIHKAKGLEFPIVVIPDTARSRRRSGPGDVALHRELGLGVRVADDAGEPVSTAMHRVIGRAQEARKNAEHARILYVGMTRARDWLLIGGAPDPPSGSWFAGFDKQYGLTQCDDGHTFHGSYDENPWTAVARRVVADVAGVVEAIPAETTVPERSEIEVRAKPLSGFNTRERVLPVSEILDRLFGAFEARESSAAKAELGLGDPREQTVWGVSPAFRGSLVHRLFESWRFDDDPPVDAVLERECPALGAQAAMAPYLREVAARFRKSPLGKRMRAAHIEREVSFLLRLGEDVVSGTIDAVLEDGTVVDYKTGARKTETHARYEWQLALYAIAARRLKGIAPPLGLLYYVDCGETCEVDLGHQRLDEVVSQTEKVLRMPRSL